MVVVVGICVVPVVAGVGRCDTSDNSGVGGGSCSTNANSGGGCGRCDRSGNSGNY